VDVNNGHEDIDNDQEEVDNDDQEDYDKDLEEDDHEDDEKNQTTGSGSNADPDPKHCPLQLYLPLPSSSFPFLPFFTFHRFPFHSTQSFLPIPFLHSSPPFTLLFFLFLFALSSLYSSIPIRHFNSSFPLHVFYFYSSSYSLTLLLSQTHLFPCFPPVHPLLSLFMFHSAFLTILFFLLFHFTLPILSSFQSTVYFLPVSLSLSLLSILCLSSCPSLLSIPPLLPGILSSQLFFITNKDEMWRKDDEVERGMRRQKRWEERKGGKK